MQTKVRSTATSHSSSGRRVALLALVAAGAVAAFVVVSRDGVPGRSGTERARIDGARSDVARRDGGTLGAAAQAEPGDLGVHDGGRSGDGGTDGRAGTHRNWKPGEHREAWQRGFGDQGEVGAHEKVDPFVSESTIAGAKERRLEKRREREDAADATGTVAPSTVFQSEKDAEYKTINQTDPTELKDLTGDAGTIAFWLQPAWDGNSQDDAQFISIGDGAIRVYKNVNFLRFEITATDGTKASLGMPINDWVAGDWHHVMPTWDDNTHQMQLIVDGKVESQNVYNSSLKLSKPMLTIGTNEPAQRPIAPGVVADLSVRSQLTTPFGASRWFNAIHPPAAK